jgi:hypothetical protein
MQLWFATCAFVRTGREQDGKRRPEGQTITVCVYYLARDNALILHLQLLVFPWIVYVIVIMINFEVCSSRFSVIDVCPCSSSRLAYRTQTVSLLTQAVFTVSIQAISRESRSLCPVLQFLNMMHRGIITSVISGIGNLMILVLECLCIRHHYRNWKSYRYLEVERPNLTLLIRVIVFSCLVVTTIM